MAIPCFCVSVNLSFATMAKIRLLINCIVVGAAVLNIACAAAAAAAAGGSDKDKQECTEQLAGLATCLPYVGGDAKAPTPDCCAGLKQVLNTNKKCLCLIIKDRNDPDLGLNINVTLALSLPTVCNAPANVSKCPDLLHLDPKSPEAQVFYQFAKGSSNDGAGSTAPSPSVEGNSASAKSEGASDPVNGGAYGGRQRWLGLEIVAGGALFLYFTGSHLFI